MVIPLGKTGASRCKEETEKLANANAQAGSRHLGQLLRGSTRGIWGRVLRSCQVYRHKQYILLVQ